MDYQEIDIGDDGPDGVVTPRMYLVPDDDGISLMCRGLDDPEREIFLSTAEVGRFAAAAGYVPAAEVERLLETACLRAEAKYLRAALKGVVALPEAAGLVAAVTIATAALEPLRLATREDVEVLMPEAFEP